MCMLLWLSAHIPVTQLEDYGVEPALTLHNHRTSTAAHPSNSLTDAAALRVPSNISTSWHKLLLHSMTEQA